MKNIESINLTVTAPNTRSGHQSVVITRVLTGCVYFYNPSSKEIERNQMFDSGKVTISGNGELPAEASITQQDSEGRLMIVFRNRRPAKRMVYGNKYGNLHFCKPLPIINAIKLKLCVSIVNAISYFLNLK